MRSFVKVAVIICLCLPSILAEPKRKTPHSSRRNGVYKPPNLYTRRHSTLLPNDRISDLTGVSIDTDGSEEIFDVDSDEELEKQKERSLSVTITGPNFTKPNGTAPDLTALLTMLLTLLGTAQTAKPEKSVTSAELQLLLAQLKAQADTPTRIAIVPLQAPLYPTTGDISTAIRQNISPGMVANQPALTQLLYNPLLLHQLNQLTQASDSTTALQATPSGLYQNPPSGLHQITPNALYQQTPSALHQNPPNALYQHAPNALHQNTPNTLYQHTSQLGYPFRTSIRRDSGLFNADPHPAYVNGGSPMYYYSPQYYSPPLYESSTLGQAGVLEGNQLGVLTQTPQATPTPTTPEPTTTTTTTTTPAPTRGYWWLPFSFGNQTGGLGNNSSSNSGSRWQLVLASPGRSLEGKSISNSKVSGFTGLTNKFAFRKPDQGTARNGRSLESKEDIAIPPFKEAKAVESAVVESAVIESAVVESAVAEKVNE